MAFIAPEVQCYYSQLIGWYCSTLPISGPKRYDYSEFDNKWWYWRDEKTLSDLLNEELQVILGKKPGIAL